MSFLISSSYDSSFDGVSFMELFNGGYAAEPTSGVEYTITHLPGGNNNVVQTAGQGARTLDLPIAVASAQLTLLRSKANNAVRGSLDYHAGTMSARLMKVKDVRKQMVDDVYTATLELVIA